VTVNVRKTLLKAKGLARKGEFDTAVELFTAVLNQFPQNKEAASGLASIRQARSAGVQASGVFQQELQNLVKLFNGGHLQRVLDVGQRLAHQHPDEPLVHNVLGAAKKSLLDYDAAVASFTKAIQLQPDYAEAYNNLGTVLHDIGRNEDAIASYSKAVQFQPNFSEAHNNLGNVLKDSHRSEEAVSCYVRAIRIRPDFATAHSNLGSVLSELGRYEEGIASYLEALRYKPDSSATLAKLVHQLARICDWDAMQSNVTALLDPGLSEEGVVPFGLLHIEDNPARHHQRSELYAKQKFPLQELSCIPRPEVKPERLRVGYFSADFHDHATMYLMARLFELHDSDKFEIVAYSYGHGANDSMRSRLRDAVGEFHDVRDLDDRAIAELGRSHRLDIAVDLKGYTQYARLGIFSYRVAPVQISYLGYPGTIGAPFLDYIIADQTVIPREQSVHYSEKIIYLPHSYQVNDDARKISDKAITREDAGLPETGFVFCCFNNNDKIGPNEFDIWMRLLQQVKGSVLWLFKSNKWAEENLQKEARKRGVHSERIIFADRMPNAEHLARHRLADLFLDTFNYNAHTTASDALWSGLPIVTMLGEGFAARVAGSLLTAIDLPELITVSENEYEQLALDLALNPERLAVLKAKLAGNRLTTPLFNTGLFARHIEEAYQQVYQKYFDGEPPDSILILP
jgi:protein O-GlcNAc transferase